MQEGLEGNPAGGTMKKVSRVFAVLTVPITLSFPKVILTSYACKDDIYSVYILLLIGSVLSLDVMRRWYNTQILYECYLSLHK